MECEDSERSKNDYVPLNAFQFQDVRNLFAELHHASCGAGVVAVCRETPEVPFRASLCCDNDVESGTKLKAEKIPTYVPRRESGK